MAREGELAVPWHMTGAVMPTGPDRGQTVACHSTAVNRCGQDRETPGFFPAATRLRVPACLAKRRASARWVMAQGGLKPAAGRMGGHLRADARPLDKLADGPNMTHSPD